MPSTRYEGFEVTLPPGWADVLDDATYSDPDRLPTATFAGPSRVGTLHVSPRLPARDDDLGTSPEDAEALVHEWGEQRGLGAPLGVGRGALGAAEIATAAHRIGKDFVQVWFLTDGRAVLEVSYVCSWEHQDVEAADRHALVASLRLD